MNYIFWWEGENLKIILKDGTEAEYFLFGMKVMHLVLIYYDLDRFDLKMILKIEH